ncbi:Putative uncharacterized protein [Moritella viscosa]|nr:Putative uncharacterized protein [Moritella viscosa]
MALKPIRSGALLALRTMSMAARQWQPVVVVAVFTKPL